MNYFSFLLTVFAGITGLFVGVVGFREYTNITRTSEKVYILKITKIAIQFGITSGLIFLAVISSASLFDTEYVWSLREFMGPIFISTVLGIMVTLGGAYQIYTTVLFRDLLVRKFRENGKPEKHKSL